MDTRKIGLVIVALGGGRRRGGDKVDPRVGITRAALGTNGEDRRCAAQGARRQRGLGRCGIADAFAEAVHIHDGPAVPNPPVVRHVVGRPGAPPKIAVPLPRPRALRNAAAAMTQHFPQRPHRALAARRLRRQVAPLRPLLSNTA